MMDPPRTIVGEVSCTYDISTDMTELKDRLAKPMGAIGKRFEHVISVNEERGYALQDWRMTSVPCEAHAGAVGMTSKITETIVAVFRRLRCSYCEGAHWNQDCPN